VFYIRERCVLFHGVSQGERFKRAGTDLIEITPVAFEKGVFQEQFFFQFPGLEGSILRYTFSDFVLNVCLKPERRKRLNMPPKNTAISILDAAEELFAEKGFAETSLRNITTRAGVNLAAVNYHFGSKKELIQAVFARFLTPFCEELESELVSYKQQLNGARPDLSVLLTLLARTAGKADPENPGRIAIFMRLLGLAYSQGQGHLRKFLRNEYGTLFGSYMQLVTEATPELSEEERFWRIHFMLGATVFTLSGAEALTAMAEYDLGKPTDVSQVVQRLIPFLSAGFQAPHQQ
tara:strand:- start:791 stop:1666 length:876 start_codon:yes stop_codon:yes gene_type:complete